MQEALKPRSFKLSEDTIEQLRTVALARNNTQSGALRQLIHHAYEHQILGIPRCASGNPCLVPATWEQHIALRKLAEARAETASEPQAEPDDAPAELATIGSAALDPEYAPEHDDNQPIIGQTDLEPKALPRKTFSDFIRSF